MQIQDTCAIVSGGASGLGQAVAECIVEAGGRVALLDVNVAAGHALATRLGERASFVETDVTCEAGVNAAVAAAARTMGGLNARRVLQIKARPISPQIAQFLRF